MSDEWWWRRRRRYWDEWFGFDEIEKMFEDMERFLREFMRRAMGEFTPEAFREMEKELEKKGVKSYVYGFSITIGPDGRPIIREFGNVPRRIRGKPTIVEEREPLVDVFETNGEVVVVAEMPGVEKEKIDVKVTEDGKTLIISASNEDRKYYKEVDLPAKVDPSSAKATYKNGVLEVKLKKVGKEGKGIKIGVE
ncbi:MAG: Hsp20/alpha crystallin family protein [Desulfurococcaceae archaeon]|jgi:HSP20 family protein|nr:Hsp20/alpha crystallin family protein [Desulfurococcaceae archaeon]